MSIPEPVWNALEESEGEGSNAAAYDYSQMIAMFKAGVHWLKSIKNRVQPQPKHELSEEDEAVLDALIRRLEGEDIHVSPHLAIKCLKSLKERYTWKPSDEQMEALESATENCAYSEYQDCLRELIGQLKKLRGE